MAELIFRGQMPADRYHADPLADLLAAKFVGGYEMEPRPSLSSSVSLNGNRKVNVDPRPVPGLSASSVPPWSVTIRELIDNPKPVP